MKRFFALSLCLILFACVPAARREEAVRPTATTPDGSAATAIPTESPAAIADVLAEPDRFPVTEASIALPTTVEPVNQEDHLLVYESDGATYLYAYGESILLHQGGIYARAPYNYLTEGTALTFIEPGDGTLRIIDLDDPHKTPVTVDPDAVNGVLRFATSQGGNEFLFLKNESGEVGGKPLEALYLYKDGEAKRIEQSVGRVDQFSMSLDGNALVFYMDDPLGDYCMMDGGEPERISSWIEDISEDLQTMLAVEGKTFTLHRKGAEPLLLSENYKEYWPGLIKPDGTIRWIEQDHTYWQFDGAEKKKLLENVESPNTTESGMYEFFRDGSLYVQFGDDEPLLICAKGADTRVFLSNTLEGGKRIVYGTVSDAQGAGAYMHRATYVVTVDRSGVSEPTLISDDNYMVVPFRDDYIVVKTEDTITCDLYFKGKLVGVVDDLWNDYHISGEGETQLLYYRSEGRLCRFDGDRVTVILDSIPKTTSRWLRMLEDGTFLYWDEDVLYYFDGASFHRFLEGVDDFMFAPFLKDALNERLIYD